MRSNPHLLEINVRSWLRKMQEKYSAPLTLLSIPDEEWLEIKHLGFDGVWLMGVWTTSPKAEEIARRTEGLKKELEAIRPGFDINDIGASQYAVLDYQLDPRLGAQEDLAALKTKLNDFGLKLFLDYVSNHLAIDHQLAKTRPDYFIEADREELQFHPNWFFEQQVPAGQTWLAYGRDPNFPPWYDTVQLNYFNPNARKYMLDTLLKISDMCDGVRCDMVMLTLNEVVEGTWGWLLKKKGFQRPEKEFWPEAIQAVKEKNPHFVFLAEVYWGLEWHMQEMGFDYTYDKVLYDRLRYLGPGDIKGHLRAEKMYQKRSLRFIENHDEMPAVTAFGKEKSKAAAVVISTLGGLRLYYFNQLHGIPFKVPIQYLKNDFEGDSAMFRFYEKLLKIIDHPAFHGGEWNLVDPKPCNPDDNSFGNLLCWTWTQRRTMKLIAVNYSNQQAKGRVKVNAAPKGNTFTFYDELGEMFFTKPAAEISSEGLCIDLPPFGAQMLDLEF